MFNLHVFEHEEFSLHQKHWKTSKYSEPVKTISRTKICQAPVKILTALKAICFCLTYFAMTDSYLVEILLLQYNYFTFA